MSRPIYYSKKALYIVAGFSLICYFILLASRGLETEDISYGVDSSTAGIREALIVARKGPEIVSSSGDFELKQTYEKARNQMDDLLDRIADLKRIKVSISNELIRMQKEKIKLIHEKASLVNRNEKLLAQIVRTKKQLKQYELDLSSNQRLRHERICDNERYIITPVVFNPMKSYNLETLSYKTSRTQDSHNNTKAKEFDALPVNFNESDIDFSRCPLTKEFTFSVLERSNHDTQLNDFDQNSLTVLLTRHASHSVDLPNACFHILIVDSEDIRLTARTEDSLYNKLVIVLSQSVDIKEYFENFQIVVSPSFPKNTFRDNQDIVVPGMWLRPQDYDSILESIPPSSPITRKYLAAYFGKGEKNLNQFEQVLQTIHRNSIDDLFLFVYDCFAQWNDQCRLEQPKLVELALFLIIVPSQTHDSDRSSNELIQLALSAGTIPVVLNHGFLRLPFDEVIDWRRAAIIIPAVRLPELHLILRSYSVSDLYLLKQRGKRIFEKYLATSQQILESIIAIVQVQRLNYPPLAVQDATTPIYNSNYDILLDRNCTSNACTERKELDSSNSMLGLSNEILGPREKSFASAKFRRNFSLALNLNYDLWNGPLYSPKRMYPSNPIDPVPPSEYKFVSADEHYRPIGDGLGGSGPEFALNIGGDYPNEQFTIVLLTYERKALLMRTLERLKGMAYLNKILVVWNSVNQEPPRDLLWPDVGVPMLIVKAQRNSLNNRFLPYEAIETDAIFSMDDDSPLRPDEIVFAFRVWRQSRDRIVGFPGRYHAWDRVQNAWMYNSNHSCELSMVLTGGAFFHKFYTYQYTNEMLSSIRAIVDKFMNCEDIAMNFLVAHLTRKPPIKVTSRWTFHCSNCASSLSEDDSHFRERHECLNIFASIYGYMPLLNTQHRSDSILFKTRLPLDKQKCYKFV